MAGSTGIHLDLARARVGAAAVVFAVGAVLASGIAAAEGIEEVVVTAQKRTENVQDVPIAISAYTAETLQSKGLNDLTRLSALTPNVNLDGGAPFSGDSSVLSASIRGIGQDDFAFNLDPGVGVYLDGVFLARTIGANQNLLDVDRIEILKGPQGTLFGRNTIGGAINIVTHTPGDVAKVVGTLTLGQYNRHDIQLTADMPINSNILTTLSASSQTQDGWQKVVPYPSDSTIGQNAYMVMGQADMPKAPGSRTSGEGGGKNLQALRGKILIHANDKLDVTISGDWTHENQSGLANTVMGVFTSNQTGYIDPNGEGAGALFGGPLMGNFYNMCITTPVAGVTTPTTGGLPQIEGAGPFNTVNGLCGPLGVGTWSSTTHSFSGNGFTGGVPALGGQGAVGVPNVVLQQLMAAYPQIAPYVHLGTDRFGGSVIYPGKIPRLYWDFENTQTGNIDTTYATGASFARFNAYGGSVTFDWTLTDNMKLKSITGARSIVWDVGTDLDGTPESQQEVTDEQKQHQFSQELQLTGKAFSNRLDYALGLYYFTEGGYVHDFVPFNTAYLWIYDYKNDVNTKSYAAYAHLDFKVTDRFGVTVGGRYSKEKKAFEGGQGDLDGFSYKISTCVDPSANANLYLDPTIPDGVTCQMALGFPDPNNPLRYFPPGVDHQDWNVFTPTFGLQFHANDDVMLYASYSKGFKSGGWTTRLSNPKLDSAEARFDPEYNKALEIGVKSEWFNRHVQANLALFQNKYQGVQINVQEGPSPVMQNAGDATIRGAELELQGVMDNGLGLGVNAGYIDAFYTYLNPCLLYIGCDKANGSAYSSIWGGFTMDTELPKTPKYKIAISPSYQTQLPGGSKMSIMADYSFTAHLQNTAPNTPLLERPSTKMLNASIHWMPESGRYEWILGGTNLTNDRYLTVGSTNSAAGEIVGSYNPPRMWYVSVKAKIGD